MAIVYLFGYVLCTLLICITAYFFNDRIIQPLIKKELSKKEAINNTETEDSHEQNKRSSKHAE